MSALLAQWDAASYLRPWGWGDVVFWGALVLFVVALTFPWKRK